MRLWQNMPRLGVWLTKVSPGSFFFTINTVCRGLNNQARMLNMLHCPRWRVAALLAGMALVGVGCSSLEPPTRDAERGPEPLVRVFGHPPNWSLDDMARRSDAIVIGRLTRQLRTERKPGGNNDPPRFYYEFTDYEFSVERSLQPAEGFPSRIAVLAETGMVTASGVDITDDGVVPEYRVGERVLLFLESLDDDRFSAGPGSTTPGNFGRDAYYLVIVGGRYAKLVPRLVLWVDSRTHMPVTVSLVENAVRRHEDGR